MTTQTSRRAILAGAITLPTLSVPTAIAAVAQPDPAYAAIEAHKRAYAFHGECMAKADAIEAVIFERYRKLDERLDTKAGKQDITRVCEMIREHKPQLCWDDVRAAIRNKAREMIDKENNGDEMDRLREEGCNTEWGAMRTLFATVPSTAAGAAVMLSYIGEEVTDGKSSIVDALEEAENLAELLGSIEQFLRKQTAS